MLDSLFLKTNIYLAFDKQKLPVANINLQQA